MNRGFQLLFFQDICRQNRVTATFSSTLYALSDDGGFRPHYGQCWGMHWTQLRYELRAPSQVQL